MARWRKHARFGLGLFAVAFAIVLWIVTGERRAPEPAQAVERLDPAAASEIRGGDAIQVKGAQRDIRVEFASQVAYADGRTKYTGFNAFIENRGGRSFVISGDEAWIGKDLSGYDLTGGVTLKSSDGLVARTPRATFTEAEGIVRGEGPVQFQRGRVSGSGVGFSYDRAVDRLWLLDKAVIDVAPAADGGGMRVTAGSAGHSRAERYMRFERGMRMERDGQIMEAVHTTVFLLKDRDEAESIELRGGSKITGGAGAGSLQAMQAQDINLRYASDGRTLERALLMRQGAIQLARPDGSTGQQLTAELIDAMLAADGAVTALSARDNVRVAIPATADASARTVLAPALTAAGEAGRGLTTMTFDGGAEYREDASKETGARVARSRTLRTTLSPVGAIHQAVFSDAFRFEDGRLQAASDEATYDVTKGTLALRSPGKGTRPHLADERVTLDAEIVDVSLSPRRIDASGGVSAQFSPGRRPGERGTTLLNAKEPVLVTSEKFSFDEASGRGTYTGRAVLFQGATQIRGDRIEMNDRAGTLAAAGNVITSLPIAGSKADAGMSLARAAEFGFDDARRHAVYSKQAQFEGVQGNLRADRIELFLAPKDNTLDRLEASGGVTAVVDKRQATGEHLVYHPSDERYVLAGTPVRLVQGCQESSGRTLTFYRTSDRILVDGNQEIRVQTKGDSKCPEPPAARPDLP